LLYSQSPEFPTFYYPYNSEVDEFRPPHPRKVAETITPHDNKHIVVFVLPSKQKSQRLPTRDLTPTLLYIMEFTGLNLKCQLFSYRVLRARNTR
jgi:hypothetical protein